MAHKGFPQPTNLGVRSSNLFGRAISVYCASGGRSHHALITATSLEPWKKRSGNSPLIAGAPALGQFSPVSLAGMRL